MAKPILSRIVVLAILAAIAAGFAAPASAKPYNRNGAERGELIDVPIDSNCVSRAWCDLARY
jgi:hypothetical protein